MSEANPQQSMSEANPEPAMTAANPEPAPASERSESSSGDGVRGWRIVAVHVRINVLHELQYRANFFAQLMESVILVGSALIVLALVFSKTDDLNGWTRPELLAVVGVYTLLGGVIRGFIEPAMQKLLTDIQRGTLDQVLTRPADAQLLVSVRDIQIWQSIDILLGLGIVGVAVAQLSGAGAGASSTAAVTDALAFVALVAMSCVLIYCTWLIVSTGGFWLVRMDMVHELFNGLYRSAQYPITVYPTWLRAGLTYIIPLGIAVTAPAEAVTSRLTWSTIGVCSLVTVGAVTLSRAFWRIGVRRYSGASA